MIPVFVISLSASYQRRATISAKLDELGIPFDFFPAIDGRHGLPPECESQIDREIAIRTGSILTDAEFACALSHTKVYQEIVRENIDWALILEDDAIPMSALLPYLAEKHYEDASLTQLGVSLRVAYVNWSGEKRIFGPHKSYLRAPRLKLTGAYGYIISQGGAKHFVDTAMPITSVADWPDGIEGLVSRRECRVVIPNLIRHQDQVASVIGKAGRSENKRRLFGIYIPPFRKMVDSYSRSLRKPFFKRVRVSDY